MILGPGAKVPGTRERAGTREDPMKRLFSFSILVDLLVLAGMVAIVVGIALSGNVPLAVSVAGADLIAIGVLLRLGVPEEDGGGSA